MFVLIWQSYGEIDAYDISTKEKEAVVRDEVLEVSRQCGFDFSDTTSLGSLCRSLHRASDVESFEYLDIVTLKE